MSRRNDVNDYHFPRCRIIPEANYEVSVQIDGRERLRWHAGRQYTRPFFYPLIGPSGTSLTRMGHPGAANHDHHKSVWFAHNKVLGIDFWSENTDARIRQQMWYAYQDGDDECRLASNLRWYDGHDPKHLLEQEMIVSVAPYENDELLFELQATFTPAAETLEFGKTNFGFLAVRVAKNISNYFGGGQLTSSQGARGEENIFGKPARWMDYSGPVPSDGSKPIFEGITYFDHPTNRNHPTHWHVRQDGWMGASVCMQGPVETTKQNPLTLRYLLHVHAGDIDAGRAEQVAEIFAQREPLQVQRSEQPHRQYEIGRKG
jgi:hypothetical protein